MSAPTLPRQIHRYRILSELGRGSMGQVYLAEDPNIERRIALKVLRPERLRGAGGDELRQRFLQEARAAGGLSHRGIVTIYDADTDPESGCPYLAMEWVRGCSLKTLLRRDGPPGTARAVSMAAQVARALDYAHRQDVVHRDVKPANLLVTYDDGHPEGGPTEYVKVVDFGIAKLVSKSLTQPGRVLGSPYYMAPEQVRGLKVDGRSDLFSLGAVLYECLTGRVAFGGETVAGVTHKILTVDPRPIDNPEVPASLRAVVRRALEKLPQNRYRSGAELAAALETVAAELALGHVAGRFSQSAATGGTTTEVMHPHPSVATISGHGSPAADLRQAPAAGAWHWPRALALVALVLMVSVLLGRSVDPQILDVADQGAGARAGPATEATEDVAPPARPPADRQAVPVAPVDPSPPERDELNIAPVMATSQHDDDAAEPFDPPVMDGSQLEDPEAEPEAPDTPPVAAVTSNLEIIYENRLKLAYFSVWIDGRRALQVKLETKNPFKRITGREHRWSIPVPAGERSLEIRLSGPAKQLEARNEIRRTFSEEDHQRLIVELWPDSRHLGFQWESLPAAPGATPDGGDEPRASGIE